MTKFVSIDPSTNKTGLAYFEDGELVEHLLLDLSAQKANPEQRFDNMAKEILEYLSSHSPAIVWAEETWNAQNIQTTKTLSELLGIIHGWCIANNIDFHKILPSQWRKLCGIEQGKKKRAELKQASMAYVLERYGLTVNDDVADAIALGDGVINGYSAEKLFE